MPHLTPLFLGHVTRGLLLLDRPQDFAQYVRGLNGQYVEIVVRKRRTQRSLRANAYYFGVVVTIIAEHLGYAVEEAHEALAWHFLRLGNPDDPLPRRRSTATMSTAEFAEYTDVCERYFLNDLHLDLSGWEEEYDRMRGAA